MSCKSILDFAKYAAVVLSLAICVVVGLTSSIHVPTIHTDGAFQTASGLFRLDSGQLPGRDFFPYLGVGPLLVIFPIYKIFGGDLAATVAAAKFTTMFLNWMAVSTLWLFVLRPANAVDALVGGALLLFGIDFAAELSSLPNLLAFGLEPGNSLRPVRSVLPYLVALPIYFLIKTIAYIHVRNFLISVTLGVALLWSNDFAIPTFGCFLLFLFFYFYYFDGNCVSNVSIIAATSIVVWLALLSVLTAGHAMNMLSYNFLDVAQDQWWYFGPYTAESRVLEISQLPRILAGNFFPLFVLFAAFLLAVKTRALENMFVFFIGLTIFAGGSLATIAGHFDDYFKAFHLFGVVTSLVFSFKALKVVANRCGAKWLAFFRSCFACLGLLMLGLILGVCLVDYRENFREARSNDNMFYVDELGGFIHIVFREYIDYARQNRDLQAIEDYWGLWGAITMRHSPMPVDSVIHALGSARETSRQSLKDADFLVTTRYSMHNVWQPWNLSQNYWFYDELISQYEQVLTSPTTVVWKRTSQRKAFVETPCHVSADKSSFTLPSSEPGFYRITLKYSSKGRGRYLLMIRNNISYPAGANGFLSLMPGTHSATFPVSLKPVGDEDNEDEVAGVFNFKVIGEAHAEILSCTADRIMYENDELFNTGSSFFLTDDNWIKGVARHWAGFFTPNMEKYRARFKVGRTVIFQNGDKRSVTSVVENGQYLNIFVDGEILNPDDVGLPNEYKVLQ